jgi:hypothetical protein
VAYDENKMFKIFGESNREFARKMSRDHFLYLFLFSFMMIKIKIYKDFNHLSLGKKIAFKSKSSFLYIYIHKNIFFY